MSFVPYVVEQSAHGERSYDIFSRLLNDRIIVLSEDVNDTTVNFNNLCSQKRRSTVFAMAALEAELTQRPRSSRLQQPSPRRWRGS